MTQQGGGETGLRIRVRLGPEHSAQWFRNHGKLVRRTPRLSLPTCRTAYGFPTR
jgi:hypothetical protein